MLKRYNIYAYGDSDDCEAFLETEEDAQGSWIKVEHLKEALQKLQKYMVYNNEYNMVLFSDLLEMVE